MKKTHACTILNQAISSFSHDCEIMAKEQEKKKPDKDKTNDKSKKSDKTPKAKPTKRKLDFEKTTPKRVRKQKQCQTCDDCEPSTSYANNDEMVP